MLIITGAILGLTFLVRGIQVSGYEWGFISTFVLFSLSVFIFLFLSIPGIFLLRRKKWAWKFSIISALVLFILSIWNLRSICVTQIFSSTLIEIMYLRNYYIDKIYRIYSLDIFFTTICGILLIVSCLFLIIFTLLLKDRKNFFKIAT